MHVWLRKLSVFTLAFTVLSFGGCLALEDDWDDEDYDNNAVAAPNNGGGALNTQALQKLMDDAVADGLPGVVIYAETPRGVFAGASGMADLASKTPMTAQTPFRVASNSKLALGITAAQLHTEGLLDLDAPISRYLSGPVVDRIENAREATSRQLLTHTAGVYDYLESDGFWNATLNNRTKVWTAEEALAFAWDEEALGELGSEHDYSNTGYLLVSLAVDKVLGRHHSTHFRSRIFDPLGMTTAWCEHHEPARGDVAHGYADAVGDAGLEDFHSWDQGYGLADGGLVMTAPDLAKLIKAVASPSSGAWLSSAARAELVRGVPSGEGELYGLGLTIEGKRYGHGGGILGYNSDMAAWPDEGVTLVVFANGSDGDLDDLFGELVEGAEALVR